MQKNKKNNLEYKFVNSLYELMSEFKTKQFKACFIDIDMHFNQETLERFVGLSEQLKKGDDDFKFTQIYCIYCKSY